MKLRIPLLICALLAAGDPLSDLRAVLRRYPANAPFSASASLQVKGDSQGVAGARAGSTRFEVEIGPGGLVIRVRPAALGAAESEAENKKRNPENLTPTRTASRNDEDNRASAVGKSVVSSRSVVYVPK
ncbi:MAG TPA: hypothetical protein VEO74_13400 [Thermoanaerobaculia bacterium]|nr:hypothetical protein [Thermoanaerobaculia bacterium]